MIMVIGPHKKKAEAKAEHRKRRLDVGGIEGGTDITASPVSAGMMNLAPKTAD